MQEALNGITVLDLSRILAGPWCTQMFADLGADVIKVEHPERGDDTRHLGPPWMTDTDGNPTSDATYFASTNRGKKSVGIDVSTSEGASLVRSLAEKADILVENYKVGDLHRYGLDYQSIKKINPEIIYCSITGYGQTGPYANRPGYDFTFQAEGGLMSITGEKDDLPGGGPQKSGVAVADLTTGLYASTAVLAALHYRSITGVGQHIDLSLLDCVTALGSNQGTSYLMNDINPRRMGNAHPALVPYGVFDACDGQIVIAIANDSQWQRLCRALDRKDLAEDADFTSASGRIVNREAVINEVAKAMCSKTAGHWLQVFDELAIPHGQINDYRQVFSDPQTIQREMAICVSNEDDTASFRLIGNPIKLSRTPITYKHAPPALSQHTRDVLIDVLGYGIGDIDRLEETGTIASNTRSSST